MNRAIIIVMMDFLISSFLLFMNVDENTQFSQVQINENAIIDNGEKFSNDEIITITQQDIDGHYEDILKEEYYLGLQSDIEQITHTMQSREEELINKIDEISKSFSSAKSENITLAQSLDDKIKENKELTEKINISENENQKLKSFSEQIKREQIDTKNELILANNSLSEQAYQLELTKVENLKLERDLESSNIRLTEKDNTIRILEDEKDKLRDDYQHLRKQNEEQLEKIRQDNEQLKNLSTQISENQKQLRDQAKDFESKYDKDIKQQNDTLNKILNISSDINNKMLAVQASTSKLQENLEDIFKDEFKKLQNALTDAEMKLRNAQIEFQNALVSKNNELIEDTRKKMEAAQSEFNKEKSALSNLDMQNARATRQADKRVVAEARIAFTFDLTDNDFWSKDNERFDTNGILVTLSDGTTKGIAHAKPFGLLWGQYDDGLTKAELIGRVWDKGSPRSERYYSFTTLSIAPSIISVPQSSNLSGLKLKRSSNFNPYRLDQRDLKYYSQDSQSSQQNMDDWTLEPQKDYLLLPDRNKYLSRARNVFSNFEGDFIMDSDGYLICMMVSDSKCVYIFEDDIRNTSYSFNITNLSNFAKEADTYRKELK